MIERLFDSRREAREHRKVYQSSCGAWAEYYEGNQPRQTRCRPWESSMNIAGALRYLSAKGI